MSASVQALREQRNAKAQEARKILDASTGDKWNDEAKAKVDEIYAAIDVLDEQLERHSKILKIEDSLERRAEIVSAEQGRSVDENVAILAKEKVIFNSFARGGLEALNSEQLEHVRARRNDAQRIFGSQSVGTGSAGGFLVPRDFAANLIQRMAAFGGMRGVATVIQTEGGNAIDFPTVDETGQEGEIVGESQPASSGDITFGTTAIGAFKFSSKIVAVPFELLQDAAIDVEAYVNVALADRIARVTNRKFTVGAGGTEPKGAVTAAAAGKVGAAGQVVSVTYDDFIDLEHSVDPAYRDNARFMFHDTTLRAVRKLKDSQGRPLWAPGMSAPTGAIPEQVNGRPYTINQHMPVMAASAKSILFGDFKKYTIRDVMAVQLFRFADSAFVSKGQVGFLAWSRHDGNLIDASTDALKYYQNPAA